MKHQLQLAISKEPIYKKKIKELFQHLDKIKTSTANQTKMEELFLAEGEFLIKI